MFRNHRIAQAAVAPSHAWIDNGGTRYRKKICDASSKVFGSHSPHRWQTRITVVIRLRGTDGGDLRLRQCLHFCFLFREVAVEFRIRHWRQAVGDDELSNRFEG